MRGLPRSWRWLPAGPSPTVTLGEAAEMLGITEAAVLMRIFRRSLPSQVDSHGTRHVPRDALASGARGGRPAAGA